MNNAVFGKTMENVRKHRDFKLVITERRRNYLVSQPNCHTTKFLTENSLAIEMKKSEIPMNKPACLGLSMLELCKILMYEFCYDCVKSKHSEKSKLCYIETESSIVYIKTDESYRNIADDVETKLDTWNYELMKNESGGKIMAKFVRLRAKVKDIMFFLKKLTRLL